MGDGRIRVALIGTGARASYMYAPVLRALGAELELAALWGRSAESARRMGEGFGIPWYTDLDRLIRDTAPDIGVVCVSGAANGRVGLMAVQHGLNVLLETPIAYDLAEADAIIKAAGERHVKIEVAEQFHRRPMEQIKLRLIASGAFGRVHSSFNDFAGHGYHGVSVMRSYLGFEERPVRVVAISKEYGLAPHWSPLANTRGPRAEVQEHGIIEFQSGKTGIYHWTSVGYDSAARWWRSSRFLAERGMGISVGVGIETREWLSLLQPDGEAPRFITVERRLERNDGGALIEIVAHTGDSEMPMVRWENPFRPSTRGRGVQWHDDEIGVASCLMSLVNAVRANGAVSYGPHQARLDQEIVVAMDQSAHRGGAPVELPLPAR